MTMNTLLAPRGQPNLNRIDLWVIDLRDGMGSYFVAISIQILDLTVISPFVRDVKSGRYRAAIWVDSSPFEQLFIVHFIQIIHGVVERNKYYLWYFTDG